MPEYHLIICGILVNFNTFGGHALMALVAPVVGHLVTRYPLHAWRRGSRVFNFERCGGGFTRAAQKWRV